MGSKTILEICTEKGYEYAQEIGCALSNLRYGFYRVLELGEELEESKIKKENKVKEIEENITKTKTEIDNKTTNIQSIEKELDKLKKECNSYTSERNKKEKEIEHNNERLKKGEGAFHRDKLEYGFIMIAFCAITVALVFVYFFFWYNAFFSSANANTYTSVIDSNFFITAITDNNYLGLIASFSLVALPLTLSFFFHSNLHSKDTKAKVITYGTLLFALAMDIFLAYSIVEHVFASKIFMGSVIEKEFTFWECLKDISFWLILSISFFAYLIWGLVFFKLKDLKKPDEAINNTIKNLENEKIAISSNLDECNFNIKFQEEKRDNEMKNVENMKKILEEIEKNLETIKVKPITTELDLKMKVSSFYVGFINAYRKTQIEERGRTNKELENEMNGKDSVVDSFVEEVKQSGKYLFI